MRIAQSRTPPGCFLAIAALWTIFALADRKHPTFHDAVIGILITWAVCLVLYRRVYPDSALLTDAPPQPGEAFRGKIETPLKREPGVFELRLELQRRFSGNSDTIWNDSHRAHAAHGEQGIVLPVYFSIPAGVQKDIDE